MQLLCFYQQPPSSLFVVHKNGDIFKDKRFITNPSFSSSSCFGIVRASLKEDSQSQQYEVEPEKAREALKKLDEQMQSLSSKKQPSNASKLNKISELKLPTEQQRIDKDKLEISDSFLGSVAGFPMVQTKRGSFGDEVPTTEGQCVSDMCLTTMDRKAMCGSVEVIEIQRLPKETMTIVNDNNNVRSGRRRPSCGRGRKELTFDVSEGKFPLFYVYEYVVVVVFRLEYVSYVVGLLFCDEYRLWCVDAFDFCDLFKSSGPKNCSWCVDVYTVVVPKIALKSSGPILLDQCFLSGDDSLSPVPFSRRQSVVPERLELLTDDRGALHMVNIAMLNDEVHLYVIDGVVNDEVDVATQVEGEGEVQVRTEMENGHGEGRVEGEVESLVKGLVEGEVEREVDCEVEGEAEGVTQLEEGPAEGNVEREVECEVKDEAEGLTQLEEAEVDKQIEHNVEEAEVANVDEVEVHDVDDFELEDVEEDEDEDENIKDDEDENVDESSSEESLVDVTIQCHNIGTSKGNVSEEQPCSSWTSGNDDMHDVCGLSDNEWVSDELDNGPDSEDESSIPRTLFPTFTMPKSLGEYKWEVGTHFTEKKEFIEAIRTYALSNGRNLKFLKNDKRSWQLRKVINDHTCSRDFNVKMITSKWLSKRMEKTVRENPNMKVMDIRDKVSRKWNVGISRNMAFRARFMAKDNVDGSFKEQYRRLYDYGHELLRANPGSTVKIKIHHWLDECFSKAKYEGELLTAVGRDANEQILPIAYAILETWFLDLLIGDLGGKDVCGACTFMSDQQKGLLTTIDALLPRVEQRFCVRHLYSNFRKQFPGKDLKRLMWTAATATYPQVWEDEMRKIKEINVEAFKYLIAIAPRSRFTSRSQCDTLVNNRCEGFNSVLVHIRTKPIITMLEKIRVYIMKRWAKNRTKMALYQGTVCPKVLNIFQKQSWLTRYWLLRWSSDQLFEIIHISQFGKQFVVNLDKKECSCRKWLITGIPCTHRITAMKFLNVNAEDYIATCYRKSTYEETYNSIIYPINGQVLWDKTSYRDILPPKKRSMPGRPKKKRRLESWELKKNNTELRKGESKKACAVCKQLGHNKRSCPQRQTTTDLPTDQPSEETQVSVPPAEQPSDQTPHVPAADE
ncbi:hypothetical protein V8G54_034049 [Vigna mungo]|uniref:SWIM-type domain-containing protein n=1 Tax=Vigna mungo TaxID=3915 RepID=A0AAQ3RI57_VIGMU